MVQTTKQRQLWAYATTFWSIPVTTGYGRRIRFLVFDRYNDKLIGIFGLSDPIIGLGIRDRFIGWTKEQKLQRLYNCMTAYILGSVLPYNLVLGSKLIALCLMFPEVRKAFHDKYKDRVSLISGQNKKAHLIYIDTLGAFGKSAIYTRLMNWKFIDYTKGQSHLHITANGSWELIKQVVPDYIFDSYKFGQGANWKMRILKIGLRELGFSEDILSIGWQRGYYNCPLANNWQEYLLGKSNKPIWKNFKKSELVEYWKNRWIIPRLEKLENNLDDFN
ncbi:Druantia anti-phage system protein DruA [Okeania sp. SIO1I7]|uniref:Druantia anti-phage system protein DruA n=1 Tax=Okeania sp. SIO1I7 TaxID=2607772 RepID=UPI003454A978